MPSHTAWKLSRRRVLVAAAGLGAAGVAGWAASRPEAAAPVPPGWYLAGQARPGSDGRRLVARAAPGANEQVIDGGLGVQYLAVAASPDNRFFAVLKRVPRGSMPSDNVSVYDRRTFKRLSGADVEIPFQSEPTYAIGWSADSARLAVPYNTAARTLIFGVNQAGKISVSALLDHAHLRFHPTDPERIITESARSAAPETRVISMRAGQNEQVLDVIAGADASWSPDGLAVAYTTGTGLVIRDETTRAVVRTLPLRSYGHAWSPDSRHLVVYTEMRRDPLGLAALLPDGIVPGLNLSQLLPCLLVYERATGATRVLFDVPARAAYVAVHWLDGQWLLVCALQAERSFLVDSTLQHRRPSDVAVDTATFLAWLAR